MRGWLDARGRTIATLRCLGASARLVMAVCLIQVMVLAWGGILLGLVLGALGPMLFADWLKQVLPVPPVVALYPGPLLLAATYGLLTAFAFSLWPLGRAARIPGGALFRDDLLPELVRPTRGVMLSTTALAAGLAALTFATVEL